MKTLITYFIAACALLASHCVTASAWDIWRYQLGYVMARGLVTDEAGNPIYVEYTEDGAMLEGWSYTVTPENPVYVLPAAEMSASLQLLSQLQQEYQNKARVLTIDEFNSAEFKTVSGAVIPKFSLPGNLKSVLVKPANQLLSPSDNPLLLGAKFNMKGASVPGGSRSVLLDRSGNIVKASPHNITFKSAYFEGQDLTSGQAANLPAGFKRSEKPKIYEPVKGTVVEAAGSWLGGYGSTDEDGKYVVNYALVPCPCFTFDYTTPLIARYDYTQFTSSGIKPRFTYLVKTVYDTCVGYDACPVSATLAGQMARVAVIGILASIAQPVKTPINFYIDTGFIAGSALLQNPDGAVGIGGATQYVYKAPDLKPISQTKYDFDGDGKFERSLLGNLVDGQFVCSAEGANAEYQGVYFSSLHASVQSNCADSDPELTQPDVLRLADTAPDFSAQGLVGQIATADLQDTDVFVFRESTGMLITRRQGISAAEVAVKNGAFQYQIMIRGPTDIFGTFIYNDREAAFAKFQSNAQMNPQLHRRIADHLKPGEAIRVVLINRKTGYTGSLTTEYVNSYNGGMIRFAVNSLVMQPPNLKISVERRFSVQEGMSKDDPRKHLIAYESSAMSSDDMLVLTTEWYDADGTPLPDALADYGFTGRLARVAGPGQLTTGGQLGHFAIRPGKHIEHIRLQDDALPADHYYVQVSGQPSHQSPDFSGSGAGNGPLAERPKHYVPFKVPVLDEAVTLEQAWLYKKLKQQGQAADIPKPEPVYRWVYRPELQFSTYQLKVQDILREESDGLSSSLYGKTVPMIATSDNLVRLMYGLLQSNQQALAFLGAGQQLVFALGEHEVKVRMGEGQQLIFDRLEHLASLDVADFVTLRLYNNNDPTNVLWEYAFETLAADTRTAGGDNIDEDGTYYVSADEPVVPLQAVILGYANRANKPPLNVTWTASGAGVIANVDQQYKEQGVFPADIELMPITGSRAVASAGLDASNQVKLPPFVVVPGKPAVMHASLSSDSVHMRGHQQINVQVSVKDAHGNAVADGTSVSFSLEGHAVIAQSDEGTQGGVAQAVIIGGNLPDNESALIVRVAEMEQRLPFTVKPLQVRLESYPTQMEARQNFPVKAIVTDSSGAPVGGIDVMFVASAGRFSKGMITTDGAGRAETSLHSGFHNIANVEIVAMVGPIVSETATSSVKPQGDNYAQTHETVVVGDEAASGIAQYERFDGLRMGIPFETRAEVQLIGKAGDTLQLELGSLSDPNLQPIASYIMSDLHNNEVTEQNGLHGGVARHLTLVEDNPTQTGSSYRFAAQAYLNVLDVWESSSINIAASDRFKPANSSGFRLDLKLEQAGGSIFSLEGGVQQLQVLENGSLEYTLYTSTGKQTVTTEPLQNGKWYTVAGRYKDNRLELEVSGLGHYHTTASGTLKYSISQRGLTIGEGFSGNLSALKFYNWDSAPLLTFADGSTSLSHTLQSVEDSIEVVGTGALNQSGEQLQMLRVGFSANQQQSFVGVVSKDYFAELAVFYADVMKPDGYPEYGAYNQRYTPFPFIGVAHAGIMDWIFDNGLDVLREVVGFLIPYEDGIGLVKQLYYLARGDDRYDTMELTLHTLGVLSVIPLPPTKALLPLVRVLRPFLRQVKQISPNFIKSLGGVMAKVADDLFSRRFDRVLTLMPMLIIIGEMALDEEARAGALMLMSSVNSADDIFAWAEYFSLPEDGWEGDEPPELDFASAPDVSPYWSPLSPFIGEAYAAAKKGKRMGGIPLGRSLAWVRVNFGADVARTLSQGVRVAARGMKVVTSPATLRKMVTNPTYIAFLALKAKHGVQGLQNFVSGKTNTRIPAPVMVGIFAFLEAEMHKGGIPDIDGMHSRIRGVYGEAFTAVFKNRPSLTSKAHGGMYHLLKIAQFHMEGSVNGQPLRAVEARRDIHLSIKKNNEYVPWGKHYERNVDIVLGKLSESENWYELKSYKSGKNLSSTFSAWNPEGTGKNTTKPGRQIMLDRIAKANVLADGVVFYSGAADATPITVSTIHWLFQQFKIPARRSFPAEHGITEAEFGKTGHNRGTVLDYLSRISSVNATSPLVASLGYAHPDDNLAFKDEINSIARRDNIKNWIKSNIAKLIENAPNELLETIIAEIEEEL